MSNLWLTWQHLTCSHAAMALLAIALPLGALLYRRLMQPRPMATPVRRPTYVVDYSVARAKAIAWLGDRYLLARPIHRALRPGADVCRCARPEPVLVEHGLCSLCEKCGQLIGAGNVVYATLRRKA